MKKIEELGISPWPWEDGYGHYVASAGKEGERLCVASDVRSRDLKLIAAAPKLYQKAYEVADNLLIHLMTPYQTIEIHRDEVAAMVKDLQSALAMAAGENEKGGE